MVLGLRMDVRMFDVLGQIVTALAATAVKTKDSKLFDQAATVAQGSGRPECKADALRPMAAAAVNTKDSKLLDQAVGVARKIERPAEEANALRQIANTLVTAGDKAKAGMLLDRAAAVAEGLAIRRTRPTPYTRPRPHWPQSMTG